MSAESYHRFVPPPGQSNIAGSTPRAHTQARMRSPRAQELFETWAKLAAAPFQGLTTDGHVQSGLFSLAPQDAPAAAMVEAANALLDLLTAEQRAAMCLPVDSQLWRHWQNTELYVEHHGLRLDDPAAFESAANQIAGVVTVGLFARRRADVLIVAGDGGVRTLIPEAG